MALAPQEGGRILKKEELAQALQKAQVKKVYLFGCKAGLCGLARQLPKDVSGATVYGTFGSLDVDWEQRKDPDGTFTNKFDFKEPLTEYTGGFQTKDGRKTKQRRHERGDPITMSDDPFGGRTHGRPVGILPVASSPLGNSAARPSTRPRNSAAKL